MMRRGRRGPAPARRTRRRPLVGAVLCAIIGLLSWTGQTACAVDGPAATETTPAEDVASPQPMERIDWVIDSMLSRPELSGARVGVVVEALDTGSVLFERNADAPFIPASNMKIVTAAAALDILGTDFVYRTVVSASGPIEKGRLRGDLHVRGSGDPSFVFEEMVRLVESIRLRGVRAIDGDVVLDDSLFATNGPVDPDAVDGDRAYHARAGALSFNFNAVSLRVIPGERRGDPVRVALSPETGFVDVRNNAVTASSRARTTLSVGRRSVDGRNVIEIDGRLAADAGARSFYRSLDDPTGYFGAAFAQFLERGGIELSGEVRRGSAPDEAETLLTHESKPMALIVRDLGKYSNNFMAEQVLLTLDAEVNGGPATTGGGAAVVHSYLEDVAGPVSDAAPFRVVDGSGFSRANRLSPRTIARVLRRALTTFETSYEFGGSLSVSGTDGTLSDRMGYPDLSGWVRAKTGLLDGVTAISGTMETRDGEDVIFSILINGFGCQAWRSHDLEHAILGSIREGRGS